MLLDLLWITLEISTVGFLSFVSAYAVQRLKNVRGPFVCPEPQTIIRLIVGRRVARVRFDSESGSEWILENPIARDEAPVVAKGLPVYGSFGSRKGVVRFRSTVVNMLANGKIVIEAPKQTLVQERRLEPRISKSGRLQIEGLPSDFIDLSPIGGKFATAYRAERGERIRLDLPGIVDPTFGWVLESGRNQLRVRFEERIDLESVR